MDTGLMECIHKLAKISIMMIMLTKYLELYLHTLSKTYKTIYDFCKWY